MMVGGYCLTVTSMRPTAESYCVVDEATVVEAVEDAVALPAAAVSMVLAL